LPKISDDRVIQGEALRCVDGHWSLRDGTVIPPETLLLAIAPNTMPLVQAETVQFEVLGGSTGRRDQVFATDNVPVLTGSLGLEIDPRVLVWAGESPSACEPLDDSGGGLGRAVGPP
jgi:hypothetical protein